MSFSKNFRDVLHFAEYANSDIFGSIYALPSLLSYRPYVVPPNSRTANSWTQDFMGGVLHFDESAKSRTLDKFSSILGRRSPKFINGIQTLGRINSFIAEKLENSIALKIARNL